MGMLLLCKIAEGGGSEGMLRYRHLQHLTEKRLQRHMAANCGASTPLCIRDCQAGHF